VYAQLLDAMFPMAPALRIPDDLASRLGEHSELHRRALEAFARYEYRAGHLTRRELRRLLRFETQIDGSPVFASPPIGEQ
jgi:hypothetical protein